MIISQKKYNFFSKVLNLTIYFILIPGQIMNYTITSSIMKNIGRFLIPWRFTLKEPQKICKSQVLVLLNWWHFWIWLDPDWVEMRPKCNFMFFLKIYFWNLYQLQNWIFSFYAGKWIQWKTNQKPPANQAHSVPNVQ